MASMIMSFEDKKLIEDKARLRELRQKWINRKSYEDTLLLASEIEALEKKILK